MKSCVNLGVIWSPNMFILLAKFVFSVLPRILGRPGAILTVIFNYVCRKPEVV